MSSFVLGIEIGGTKLQAALGTPAGEIVAVERGDAPASDGAEAIVAWFEQPLQRLRDKAKQAGGSVRGLGIGFGGPVDSESGTVIVSHQVEGWNGFPIKAWFEERLGLPVSVANDSNAAGWAEYCRGAGQGTRHFCYINIGSGIGGALVIDGRLHNGQGLGAAEIGHTYVPDWTSNTPGAVDKLENLCSGWSIEKRVRTSSVLDPQSPLSELCGGNAKTITCGQLAEAARRGDGVALAEIDHVARALGIALANVIALAHPERIALGGGVSLMGNILLDPIRQYVGQYAFEPYRGHYEIIPCVLEESVVLVGSLLLAP